jgi:hypothetical protein
LALATEGGIAVELPPSAAATAVVSTFFLGEDFSATLLDFRCECFFQWREPCRTYLRTATASPAALSVSVAADFESVTALSSAAAAAGDGPAKQTNKPVAMINADRPPALMVIDNSPHSPAPERRNEPATHVRSGAEKGNFRTSRAKAGQRYFAGNAAVFSENALAAVSLAMPGSKERF